MVVDPDDGMNRIKHMPEGPEIKRSANAIAQVLEGNLIDSADLHHDALTGYEHAIIGQTVDRIECRGKALLTHFSSGKTMYSHNQLYGLWRVTPRGKLVATKRALRIALHTANHSALLYSATDISFWDTCEIEQHPFLQRLGPDLLASDTQADTVLALLELGHFRNRQLASLYLDQGFIAGNGNYLRSEILFFAGVNPLLKPRDMTQQARNRLAKNTIRISQRSYRTGGITLPPSMTPKDTRPGRRYYERDRFAVFARDGKPCRVCRTPIKKSVVTSRRIYWCPQCQPS